MKVQDTESYQTDLRAFYKVLIGCEWRVLEGIKNNFKFGSWQVRGTVALCRVCTQPHCEDGMLKGKVSTLLATIANSDDEAW